MTLKKNDFTWLVIVLCAGFYLYNIFSSTAIYDPNDGLEHLLISKYAPKHPLLFLNHWGKPLFTFLSSPFAQFGIKGVMIFNLILFVLTARLMVLFLKNLNMKFAWAAPMLLACTPVYFLVVMSGLTEVLFAFLVMLGLYFYSKNKYVLAAFVITWLSFARSEAYFIFPLFGLAFLLRKEWSSVFMMGLGPLFMSVLGWIFLGDFFWLVTQNPYVGAGDIYGSGDIYHFIDSMPAVFGTALGIVGLLGLVFNFAMSKSEIQTKAGFSWLIAGFSAIFVFVAHSVFWWKGLYGSLGLLRVMATVSPLVVLFSVYLFNRIVTIHTRKIVFSLVLLLIVLSVVNLFEEETMSKEPDEYELMVQELASWHRNSEHANNPNIWFQYPPIGYYLNIDNYEENDSRHLWHLNHILPSNAVRNGGLIIYDGARAPNEGKTSQEMLFADRHLKLIHKVQSEYGLKEMNDFDFEFLVFEKHIDAENDTLAYTNFTEDRPIFENRIHRIGTDTAGRRYFSMVTLTNYYEVFAFWEKDSISWKASDFEFDIDSEEEIDLILLTEYEDGTDYAFELTDHKFVLPKEIQPVIKRSLIISNPHPEEELRVYSWRLMKR